MGTTVTETPEYLNTVKRYSGKVKWFNNKTGYGFITINSSDPLDVELNNTDIFVHHSVINVKNEQYKYLVQGEYVELSLLPAKNHYKYKYQANDVSGVGRGNLLCESRFLNEKQQYKSNNSQGQWEHGSKSKKTSPLLKMKSSKVE